jgi:hypothetical protein
MRKINILVACLAVVAGCWKAAGQNQNLESGGATYGPGISVHYVTVAEPALKRPASTGFSGGFAYDAKVLHRWMVDKANQSYFGYDLIVEPITGSTQCRVSILPLSLSAEDVNKHQRRVEVDSTWKLQQIPNYPPPQIVEPGDTIALDLLVSPDGSQKVVDYLRASCSEKTSASTPAESGPPRDYTLDDVALNITSGSLYVNGQPVSGTPLAGDANGAIVWFYFPGKGRFLVSIAPHDGFNFQKAGTIRRNHISFEMGGDRYEVNASHPIVGEGTIWNAYVMFDPLYQPKGSSAVFGGADRVEKALAQK